MRPARHREPLVIDARLDEAVDGLEKIVAVQLHVKAQQVAAEKPVEDLFLPGADAERLAMRPRNVPEVADDGIGTPPLDESRKQRKVIVLHEHDRRRAFDLVEHGLGELRVDARVVLPVGRVENGPRIGDMAERPERAVGEAVVVALFLFTASARCDGACRSACAAAPRDARVRPLSRDRRCRCRARSTRRRSRA